MRAFDGKSSLIRSFPVSLLTRSNPIPTLPFYQWKLLTWNVLLPSQSKVGVSRHYARTTHARAPRGGQRRERERERERDQGLLPARQLFYASTRTQAQRASTFHLL